MFCVLALLSSLLIHIGFLLLEHGNLVWRAVTICVIANSRRVSLDGFILHGQPLFRLNQRFLQIASLTERIGVERQ